MKLILLSILASGFLLIDAVQNPDRVKPAEDKPATAKGNATTKSDNNWSVPDTTSATGFAASPMMTAIYQQPDNRATPPFFATQPAHVEEGPGSRPTAKEGDVETGASKMKSDQDSQRVTTEYLRTLQQKQKIEMYNSQYKSENMKPSHDKVVFQNEYKPIKFESDFHATQFTHERAPYQSHNHAAPQVKEPYPYQFANGYGEGNRGEPAPTASAQHTVAYRGRPNTDHDHYDGGKKGVSPSHKSGLKKKSAWDKVVRLLTAFIPLGLFLAALPPSVLNINSTAPHTMGRQRADDALHGIDLFEKFGFDSLNQDECENRVFCEISRLGALPGGNIVQQGFWQLAHETPDNMAEALGFKDIFQAVRNDACGVFVCPEKKREKSREEVLKEGEDKEF